MQAKDHCLTSLRQVIACALPFAFARAGNSNPARIAMMAITTSSSIKVKPLLSALRADGWTYGQSFMLRCGSPVRRMVFTTNRRGNYNPIVQPRQARVGNKLFTIRWRWLKRAHANGKSKHQAPRSRKAPNTQAPTIAVTLWGAPGLSCWSFGDGRRRRVGPWVIGGWFLSGVWILELGVFPRGNEAGFSKILVAIEPSSRHFLLPCRGVA